jgi:UDP-glucose 4-epimerase
MTIHLIAGGAGFIGANLAERLLATGHKVLCVDDLSRGSLATIAHLQKHADFEFRQIDCADPDVLDRLLADSAIDEVWHMAANSDIPAGVEDYRVDLRQTFMTTVAILDVMKRRGIKVLHFASSSAIYGDHGATRIHEDIGPCQPISNYGAMKLASEAHIRAAHEAWLSRANIFRFPNVIGIPATHGVILDFVKKLMQTPHILQVMGNGSQQKAYLHVHDLVTAMLHIRTIASKYAVFNIGPTDEGITVREIAQTVRDRAAPEAEIRFGEGNRGWVGDVPQFSYSVERLMATGWQPTLTSREAVIRAVDEIVNQEMH